MDADCDEGRNAQRRLGGVGHVVREQSSDRGNHRLVEALSCLR